MGSAHHGSGSAVRVCTSQVSLEGDSQVARLRLLLRFERLDQLAVRYSKIFELEIVSGQDRSPLHICIQHRPLRVSDQPVHLVLREYVCSVAGAVPASNVAGVESTRFSRLR